MKNAPPRARKKTRVYLSIGLCLLAVVVVALFFLWRSCAVYVAHVRQLAFQCVTVESAILTFGNEFEVYPPSSARDDVNLPYCGTMKLTEALVGQDMRGFHPSSEFRADGVCPATGESLYRAETLQSRVGPYLRKPEYIHRLDDVYGPGNTGPYNKDVLVLCDVFARKRPSGEETGMPILYYRADPNGTAHDVNHPDNPANIYDYRDNQALIALGVPGHPEQSHPLVDPKRFYRNMRTYKSKGVSRPYMADSFILVSAGPDGLYGTADDICNFDWRYPE